MGTRMLHMIMGITRSRIRTRSNREGDILDHRPEALGSNQLQVMGNSKAVLLDMLHRSSPPLGTYLELRSITHRHLLDTRRLRPTRRNANEK
jgi:hypothetical protein